jgi:hypothetical protein
LILSAAMDISILSGCVDLSILSASMDPWRSSRSSSGQANEAASAATPRESVDPRSVGLVRIGGCFMLQI